MSTSFTDIAITVGVCFFSKQLAIFFLCTRRCRCSITGLMTIDVGRHQTGRGKCREGLVLFGYPNSHSVLVAWRTGHMHHSMGVFARRSAMSMNML